MMPGGFSWPFVVSIDLTLLVVSGVALLQRPDSQWGIALIGLAVAYSPYIVFFVLDMTVLPGFEALALGAAWMLAISIWLFGMSVPAEGDFAPMLLSWVAQHLWAASTRRGCI
jgi:hypothetical protein